MGLIVTTGATCVCTFGTGPGTLNVTSQAGCMVGGKPAATIQDCSPANITPFAMCTSMANPQVAAATAAALGVLTPQPCVLAPRGMWMGGSSTVMVGGKPVLTNECQLGCAMGQGTITITNPGQTNTIVN